MVVGEILGNNVGCLSVVLQYEITSVLKKSIFHMTIKSSGTAHLFLLLIID